MPKFFIKKNQIREDTIFIQGKDVNHIKNVLRLKSGEAIEVTCPEISTTYRCKIKEYQTDQILCDSLELMKRDTEPNTYIHIFQGLPKADKMEWIIEKGTEIGVSEFTPIEMKRSIVKLDEKTKTKKCERWQKIAEVAAKQSGREKIPIVNSVINLKNSYENLKKYDIVIVAYEKEEENTLKKVLTEIKDKKDIHQIAIIIGPEGGIDPEEWRALIALEAISVTLGRRILRTETAPLVIASNIFYEFET